MAPPANPRAVAARALHEVLENRRSLDVALPAALDACRSGERALASEMAYGAVRWHFALEALVYAMLSRPLARRDRIVGSLLEVGIYQLWQMRIPDHAAVDETVAACEEIDRPRHKGLVNALLRRFRREEQTLLALLREAPETELAHPSWLLEMLEADWPRHWRSIARSNNERAPMWVRLNLARVDRQSWCDLLPPDVSASPMIQIPSALRLSRPIPVEELPGFDSGLISVQDGAAQIAALLLAAEPGMRVLDACAAPGNKTTHILETADGALTMHAVDRDPDRLDTVAINIGRAGYEARLFPGNAAEPGTWWDGRAYDRILVDAPCSATGVIRRHPDIKLLRRPGDIGRLAALQTRMLTALWPLLAPGGRLVYCTCSVLRAENSAVFRQFSKESVPSYVSNMLPDDNIRDLMQAEDAGFQLFPGTCALDGFYYGCIEKPT